MTDEEPDEAIELLRHNNPAPAPAFERLGDTPQAAALLHSIVAEGGGGRRSWWRRPRLVAPVVAAVALASAAAGYQLRGPVARPSFAACYSAASTASTVYVEPVAASGSPAATCARLWRRGPLGHRVPPLYACVLPSGAVGVFPGRQGSPCGELALRSAAAPVTATGLLARLRRRLNAAEARHRSCLPEAVALGDARRALHETLGPAWKVRPEPGFSPGRPCAGFAVSTPRRSVEVVPQPRLEPAPTPTGTAPGGRPAP